MIEILGAVELSRCGNKKMVQGSDTTIEDVINTFDYIVDNVSIGKIREYRSYEHLFSVRDLSFKKQFLFS